MKLLQNSAGNFLNMTPQEAKSLAEKLLKAVDGSGFVQTIVIREDRSKHTWPSNDPRNYGVLDTLHVGVSPTWLDVHPSLESELKSREPLIQEGIDRSQVNVRLKTGKA